MLDSDIVHEVEFPPPPRISYRFLIHESRVFVVVFLGKWGPVNSPTTNLRSLFSIFNRLSSSLLLVPAMNAFVCSIPVDVTYRIWCWSISHFLISVFTWKLAILTAGSGPLRGLAKPVLAGSSALSFPMTPSCSGNHISVSLLRWARTCSAALQSLTSAVLSLHPSSAWSAAWLY